jgi:hypothetical protein
MLSSLIFFRYIVFRIIVLRDQAGLDDKALPASSAKREINKLLPVTAPAEVWPAHST